MSTALMFGGAFNPPTAAHLLAADTARKAVDFDKVIFVPTKQVYVEKDQGKDFAFGDQERLDMLRMISISRPWMEVSAYEIEQSSQPRSYETLCWLRKQGYELRLLMGSDKLPELEHGWLHVEEICREFGIVCMSRSHDDPHRLIQNDPYLRTLSPYFTIVSLPEETQDVSSTKVRQKYLEIQQDLKELEQMVPEELHGLKPQLLKGELL